MARSFSCSYPYVLCNAAFVPNTTTMVVGSTVNFGDVIIEVCDNSSLPQGTCGGDLAGTYCPHCRYDWQSANSGIIAISGSATSPAVSVQGVGAGSTSVYVNVLDTGSACQLNASGTGNVTPKITSISPAKGSIGATTHSVTISGAGLTGATVNGGTGITPTVKSTSSTTVVVDLAVASNAAAGNHSITVTAAGQTSNSVNFFVQIPTSLSIVAGTDSTTPEASCTFTSGGTQFTGCGVTRSFTYQVNDQESPPQPIQAAGLQFWDSFGTISPNPLGMGGFTTTCTPANNTGPCGFTTSSAGQFAEKSLGVCSTVCRSNGVCTTGGPSVVTQTWHIGPASINQTISYYCSKVLVNGQ